jgi:hypothetical protein
VPPTSPLVCYVRSVRTLVKKQLVTLTLGMAAAVGSASVGSVIQNALHTDGSFIFLPLCFSLFFLVFTVPASTRLTGYESHTDGTMVQVDAHKRRSYPGVVLS